MNVGIADAQMESDNKVVIDEKGVIPDVEPIPPENVIEDSKRKPSAKSEEKPAPKPVEKPSEKPSEKPTEKPSEKPSETPDSNSLETNSRVEIKNDVLVGNLSGREIKVTFKKDSVSAEKLYVEPLNDNDLNQTIKHKLGSDYNIIETFEIHFEKNEKRIRFKLDNPAATDINGALSNLKDGKVTDKDRENWKKYVLDPAVTVSKNVSSDITVIVKSPVDDKIILEVKGGEVTKNEMK